MIIAAIASIITVICLNKQDELYCKERVIFGFLFFVLYVLVLGWITQVISTASPSYCKKNLDFLKKEIQEIEMQIDAEQDSDSKWYLENVILEEKVKKANCYRKLIGMNVEE